MSTTTAAIAANVPVSFSVHRSIRGQHQRGAGQRRRRGLGVEHATRRLPGEPRSTTTSAPAINWGNGGGWTDATADAFPDWVQITFNGSKTIDRVVVYTLQDNYTSPVEPTDTLTFSRYGITDFTVQGWNGAAWITLATVTGNNLVKRTVTFTAFTTDRIRVNVTNALDIVLPHHRDRGLGRRAASCRRPRRR